MRHIMLILVVVFSAKINAQLVTTQTQLQNALTNATAGTTIVIANGVWNDVEISINKTGTKENPITIKAENVGQVFFEGRPQISLGGTYLVFEGFVFQNPSNLISSNNRIEPIIEFRDSSNNECKNCTVTNIKIDSFNGLTSQEEDIFKWIIVYGQYNEISHSSFLGKYGVGSIINDNRSDSGADYTKIHHNYFAGRRPVGELNALNDQDAIRIGTSSTSLSDSFTEIYNNLFDDWGGEVEIISNKSGKNKYYNNTFRDYSGTLTLRHGNNCEVFGNFFFADQNLLSGGVRVIGEGHKVYNNYFEATSSLKPNGSKTNTAGGINITNGRPNTELNGYYQVKNATIVNNTFVNCDYGIRVGTKVKSDLTLAPENIVIANNIMQNISIKSIEELTPPIGVSEYTGNITQNGSWDLTNGVNYNQMVNTGLLEQGLGFYQILETSAAIGNGYGNYPFLTNDIIGSERESTFDAGAEEFGGEGTNAPYSVNDVGIEVGFLSLSVPYISLSVDKLELNKQAQMSSFEINSNVNWTITENVDWISISPISGSNTATIDVNVLENTSNETRSATIEVSGEGVTSFLEILQSNIDFNPADAVSIDGITVTGFGGQITNPPSNTLDKDESTRWSGNSNDGSAYLTYDLQCSRIVTGVKIYFHKGSTRKSSFKIGVSDDGINFDETQVLTSSGATVGFENFSLSSNPLTQFVRIYGYGNSENSGWNSYEEIEIYGEENCSLLSVRNIENKSNMIELFPVPTHNGILNIISKDRNIGGLEILDFSGKRLYYDSIDSIQDQIDVSFLAKGIYILKTNNSVNRFVVN